MVDQEVAEKMALKRDCIELLAQRSRKRLSMNNQDILAARVGAVLRCRSLEG